MVIAAGACQNLVLESLKEFKICIRFNVGLIRYAWHIVMLVYVDASMRAYVMPQCVCINVISWFESRLPCRL